VGTAWPFSASTAACDACGYCSLLFRQLDRRRGFPQALGALIARPSARNVRPGLSDDPKDKLAAALAALGHARLRDSAEFQRAASYYDEVALWYSRLSAADQELVQILADVVGSSHKDAAEGMAASLPPAPRCPL
jgi:hypothetical protein